MMKVGHDMSLSTSTPLHRVSLLDARWAHSSSRRRVVIAVSNTISSSLPIVLIDVANISTEAAASLVCAGPKQEVGESGIHQ